MIYAAFVWSHTQEREEVLFKEGEALEEGEGEKNRYWQYQIRQVMNFRPFKWGKGREIEKVSEKSLTKFANFL